MMTWRDIHDGLAGTRSRYSRFPALGLYRLRTFLACGSICSGPSFFKKCIFALNNAYNRFDCEGGLLERGKIFQSLLLHQ